jgi:hypothetical protein
MTMLSIYMLESRICDMQQTVNVIPCKQIYAITSLDHRGNWFWSDISNGYIAGGALACPAPHLKQTIAIKATGFV